MAITKTLEVGKIEVVGKWNIQVAMDTVIKEDDAEISRSRHRHVLAPFSSGYETDEDGKKTWTHNDTDISKEDAQVQAVCNAIWTDDIKAEYKTFAEKDGVI